MIIDWTQLIKNLKSDPTQKDKSIEAFNSDLERILKGACQGELIIIRFSEGFRMEVRFLNRIGLIDPKKITKDFNLIRRYELQIEKLNELRDQLANQLKDYPEKVAELDEYIRRKVEHPLFAINYVLNNKVVKSFSGVPYLTVHMSILLMLSAFYLDEGSSGNG